MQYEIKIDPVNTHYWAWFISCMSLKSYQKVISFSSSSLPAACHKQITFHNPIKTLRSHSTFFFDWLSSFTLKHTIHCESTMEFEPFHVDFNTSMVLDAFGPQLPSNNFKSFKNWCCYCHVSSYRCFRYGPFTESFPDLACSQSIL